MTVSTSHESGRSMIEMIGVLALIGVLSIGGIIGYATAMEKYRANKAVDEIQTLIANVQSVVDVRPILKETSTEMWYEMGVFADDNWNKEKKVGRNLFDGDIIIETKAKKGVKTMLVLTYTNVPLRACRKLAVLNWDGGNAERLLSMELGEREYTWAAETFDRMLPISFDQAMEACNFDGTTFVWNFRQ